MHVGAAVLEVGGDLTMRDALQSVDRCGSIARAHIPRGTHRTRRSECVGVGQWAHHSAIDVPVAGAERCCDERGAVLVVRGRDAALARAVDRQREHVAHVAVRAAVVARPASVPARPHVQVPQAFAPLQCLFWVFKLCTYVYSHLSLVAVAPL